MVKKNKKIKDKQRAKFKAKNEKNKEIEESIQYVCAECGEEELIPEGVVEYFDIMDDGDIAEPSTFTCEKCGGIMNPKKYEGVHDITYEF
jgi:predicted RNA-binding Zn-ribbon protein involved in translation (DUF1610 family)